MQATREGRFKAVIGDVGISEKNSMCSIAMRFDLVSELTADGWQDVESEKMSILGYFYLTTKDGNLNEFVIKNFREVLMWNGRDIEHIRTARGAEVQVTLAKEEYNGKVSLKVKYMNSADYEGGVSHDEGAVKKFQAALGAKLRLIQDGEWGRLSRDQQDDSRRSEETPVGSAVSSLNFGFATYRNRREEETNKLYARHPIRWR